MMRKTGLIASCVMDADAAIKHVNDVTADGPIAVVGVAGPMTHLLMRKHSNSLKNWQLNSQI